MNFPLCNQSTDIFDMWSYIDIYRIKSSQHGFDSVFKNRINYSYLYSYCIYLLVYLLLYAHGSKTIRSDFSFFLTYIKTKINALNPCMSWFGLFLCGWDNFSIILTLLIESIYYLRDSGLSWRDRQSTQFLKCVNIHPSNKNFWKCLLSLRLVSMGGPG